MHSYIAAYLMGCVVSGLIITRSMKGKMETHILDYTSTKGYDFTTTIAVLIACYTIFWPVLLVKMFVSLKDKEE